MGSSEQVAAAIALAVVVWGGFLFYLIANEVIDRRETKKLAKEQKRKPLLETISKELKRQGVYQDQLAILYEDLSRGCKP